MHAAYGRHYSVRVPKFGRDLLYQRHSCDLLVASSCSDIYRLNLEQGCFLHFSLAEPFCELPRSVSSPALGWRCRYGRSFGDVGHKEQSECSSASGVAIGRTHLDALRQGRSYLWSRNICWSLSAVRPAQQQTYSSKAAPVWPASDDNPILGESDKQRRSPRSVSRCQSHQDMEAWWQSAGSHIYNH